MERFRDWLVASGNSTLLDISPQEVHKRRICLEYFHKLDTYHVKLIPCAVPTQYLPGSVSNTKDNVYKFWLFSKSLRCNINIKFSITPMEVPNDWLTSK